MQYEVRKVDEGSDAALSLYLHEVKEGISVIERPLILVIPGGAYGMISEREAEPVAIAFYNMGYHAAILRYSIGEQARNLQPMKEAAQAMKIIRKHSRQWNIIENKIAVCGFSAGGHLAASLGVMFEEPALCQLLPEPEISFRPDAMILCYPVITSGKYAHRDSFYNLSGSRIDDEAAQFFSLEKRVSHTTPPVFIWHTQNDDLVPVENTLFMMNALQKAGVSCEAHIFRDGPHGMSTCTKETDSEHKHCSRWVSLCKEWLEEIF